MSRLVFHQLPVDFPETCSVSQVSTKGEDAKQFCKVCMQRWCAFIRKLLCPLEIHKWGEIGSCGWWTNLIFFGWRACSPWRQWELSDFTGKDPSLYRCPAGISHSSGLVKCCKSSSIKALCLVTRCWEGDEVTWPQLSHTPWQWDWTPFSLLCFCFSPLFLSADYKHFQGKVLRWQPTCLVQREGWLLNVF